MSIWHNRLHGPEQGGGPALLAFHVQKADGTWVDISGDVLQRGGGLDLQQPGRQTELSRIDDGEIRLVVDNRTGDYTPGYASAPTSFYLGMPVRIRETVGRRSWDLFTGVMNQPEADYEVATNDATVIVTCVDWSGSQQQGRKFISNLGEWIIYNGGDTLVEYWPMTETARPFLPVKSASAPPIVSRVFASSAEPADGFARITPAAGVMPLGEDARIPVIGGPLDGSGLPAFAYHLGVDWLDLAYIADAPPIAQGEVCTTVAWFDPVAFDGTLQELMRVVLLELPGGGTSLLTVTKLSTGPVELEAFGGAMTGTITGSGMETGRPYPIAIRHGTVPSVFELWMGRKRYTGTLSGTPETSMKWGTGSTGAFWYQGSFGHLQIYVGAEATYDFDDYLAQIDFCENALTGGYARQRTDERIRTVARYAGLTDAQLDLDRGVAYMPRASMAGKTFTQLRDDAVSTEQGRCFSGPDGNLRFHNRSRTKYAV